MFQNEGYRKMRRRHSTARQSANCNRRVRPTRRRRNTFVMQTSRPFYPLMLLLGICTVGFVIMLLAFYSPVFDVMSVWYGSWWASTEVSSSLVLSPIVTYSPTSIQTLENRNLNSYRTISESSVMVNSIASQSWQRKRQDFRTTKLVGTSNLIVLAVL